MVPLNPFIVPRVIKIFGEIPSENPKCILVGDVSKSSVLVLHDFAEQNHRKKFKNYIVKVFLFLYFWEFTVIDINCSMPPLMTK